MARSISCAALPARRSLSPLESPPVVSLRFQVSGTRFPPYPDRRENNIRNNTTRRARGSTRIGFFLRSARVAYCCSDLYPSPQADSWIAVSLQLMNQEHTSE